MDKSLVLIYRMDGFEIEASEALFVGGNSCKR